MKKIYIISTVFLLVMGLAAAGYAADSSVLKFEFTGTVKSSTLTGTGVGLDSLDVEVGDPVSGSFSYDKTSPDSDPDTNRGEYDQSLTDGVTIFVGGSTIEISSYDLIVHNDYGPFDIFEIQPLGDATLDGSPIELSGDIDFTNAPGDTFSDDSLPDPLLVTSYPGDITCSLFGYPANIVQLSFDLDTITISPVPEPPPALVGYWKFDEANGSEVLDSSGFGNDGEIEGASPATGKCGGALYFDAGADGSVDYVKVPYDPSINTSEFTVSSWVSLADVTRNNVILDKRNGHWDRNFGLYYFVNESPPSEPSGNYLAILIGNGESVDWYEYAAYSLHTPNQDQFFHIAATHHHADGHSYLKLYLDGEMVVERELKEITGNVGNGDLYIGTHGYPQLDSSPTKGIIDEVRIYNYALNQEQIQADMQACVPETYTVPFDIKPESCPNPLNTKSQGVLPVAILGTADFDVNTIDAASIRLAGVAPVRSTVEDVATPVADPQSDCDCNELGGDGNDDLTLKFNTQEIVDALGEVEDGEVVELTVTGVLSDETPFEGKDCIVIRAKGGKGKVEEPDQCYASVPQTGQTKCYATNGDEIGCEGTGQDGEYQMGVVCPEPPESRFIDNLDGTVTDNCTGLIWLKNADCFGQRPWATALSDANGLASGSCGLTDGSVAGDWRLANVRELFSLIDFSQHSPALPAGHLFTNFSSLYRFYWSSTTRTDATAGAWIVSIDGGVQSDYKAPTNNVWPVRGGN